jgi:hypothetical protein
MHKAAIFGVILSAFSLLPRPILAQSSPTQSPSTSAQVPSAAPSVPEAGPGGSLNLGDPQAEGVKPSAGALTGRPTITAVRLKEPPNIDGRLDDAAWGSAARIAQFVQTRPLEGAPATEQTEVYVAYDSQQLFFGFYVRYANPGLVRANRVDRDRTENDDTVTVVFDPFLDQQSGYALSVNGYGVQGDSILRGTGGFGGQGAQGGLQGDTSWNALFESGGQLVEDGWTAEMAIPFKSLRYPARGSGQAHRWGFQVLREIQGKDETVVWAPISRDVSGFLRQVGLLDGMSDLSTSRNLEVLPSFTAIQAGTLDSTTGGYGVDDSAEGGLYLKYGVTSNLTLDFAYNPDFSQIESDRQQIEVNLRFPVNYPEQRPFFVEGQDNFRLGGPVGQMVHTRTIVDPRYGAKLTGKVGRVSMGFMMAEDQAPGRGVERNDPAFGRSAQVVAGRVMYELFSENTLAGLFTSREFLNSYSRAYGYDLQLRMGATHRGQVKGSFTDHVDHNGVRRIGHWNELNLRRQARHFNYSLHHDEIEPDVKTDLGFVRRVDVRNTRGNVSYRWWPEGAIVSWGPQYNFDWNYDFAGNLQEQNNGLGLSFDFAKNINVGGTVNRDLERYGDIDFRKTRVSFNGAVRTSRRISVSGSINHGDEIRFITNPYLGSTTGWETTVTLRPVSRLQSLITVDSNRFIDVRDRSEVFDIKIVRATTTYQFTDRLLLRNILEHDSWDKKVGVNLLVTYRVNAGTAFFVGYDDRYRQGEQVNSTLFPGARYERTNRAVFTKLQYLFRY